MDKMHWLYLRYSEVTHCWYAGKTHHTNYHNRRSGEKGHFAVDMQGKELAVQVPASDIHVNESEAIQFLIAFVGRANCSNVQQCTYPITGWVTTDIYVAGVDTHRYESIEVL